MKKLFLLAIIMWTCAEISAQDPHFSQFYGVPIGINPAYTGNFNGNFRLSAQYRDQWNSILSSEAITAYRTGVASFEGRTNKGFREHDFVGLGAYFLYDVAGQSRLSNMKMGMSAAYRISLDRYGDNFLAIGAQLAFVQKRINLNDLTWGTQWDGTQYSPSKFPGESNSLDDNLIFYDISTGLSWGYNIHGSRNRFFAGLGLLHVNQPSESFYRNTAQGSQGSAKLPMRINFNFGCGLQLGKSMDIVPKVLVMSQGKSFENMFGADLRFLLDPSDEASNSFYLGALARLVGGDAQILNGKSINFESMILTGRVDFNNMEIGAAYDFNVSDLKSATKYQGGFEIYLNYIFSIKNNRQRRMFCPKF